MTSYIYVGIGGMIGAMLRYTVSVVVNLWWVYSFPLGTLIANFIGSFTLAWLGIKLARSQFFSPLLVTALTTGIIGSFTTFSTFSVETIALIQQQEWIACTLYLTLSIVGGFYLAYLGYTLGSRAKEVEGND
jgi:fluoride exporter